MRLTSTALVTLAIAAAVGCNTDAERAVTAPAVSPRLILAGPPCSSALFNQANREVDKLFANGPTHQSAELQLAQINADCSGNQAVAREEMLAYVQFVIDAFRAGKVLPPNPADFPSPEAAVVSHWNTVFGFVNYPEPNLPASVLGPNGSAGVITQTTSNRELIIPAAAAMTVPVQGTGGDPRGHLFSIYPIPNGCLGGTNLIQTGPCFQFSANPQGSPAFSPKIKVGICEPVSAGQAIPGLAPALGHLDAGLTKVAQPVGIYPTFCIDLASANASGSWTGGFGDVARRLAWVTRNALGVGRLYAAHGGLGGVTGGLSPFGGVDLMIFKSTFSSAIGAPPGGPEAGTWTQTTKPPSSITVEQSIGDLTDRPVILFQGNCSYCGGLTLLGKVTGAGGLPPSDGIYLVSWLSLENKPAIVDAPFILRASNGLLIARLDYFTAKGNNRLAYNDKFAGSWIQGKNQKFEITVNLFTRMTSLSIDGVPVPGAQNLPFLQGALNLASISAEFMGVNAGAVGWEDVSIVRLPDP